MPHLVLLTHSSLPILGNTETRVFPISGFQVNPLISVNCQNSRTSDKKNKTTSKKMTMTSCRKIVMSLSFFRFMANLEQSGSRIPDTLSVKLTFSLTATVYLSKTENRTKVSPTQLSKLLAILLWVKVLLLPKNADISKTKKALVIKCIFSQTTYVCVT